MADVTIYRTNYCPYCDMAERLFEGLGVDYEEIDVTDDAEKRQELVERTGMRTVPQIFINGESVGGYDAVRALHDNGELESMLEE
ncbi:MAG: glutaredoxin 3 [Persicimonas sp.]